MLLSFLITVLTACCQDIVRKAGVYRDGQEIFTVKITSIDSLKVSDDYALSVIKDSLLWQGSIDEIDSLVFYQASLSTINIPDEQRAGNESQYSQPPLSGGMRLRFDMTGITRIEMESVDGYTIAGTASVVWSDRTVSVEEFIDSQYIINFTVLGDGTLQPGTEYVITTYPCNIYGGYRLSIYKDGLVAHYFGVHQIIEANETITPFDLVEDELDFVDPSDPLVEEERPGLNQQTRDALTLYRNNPTQENKDALLEQMGIRYDKVVARKKSKLRQLEREAHDQYLIDEMQMIVDEMVENREIRLEQQFLRLIDPREDDDPTDQWLVLRGSSADNAYISYAPVTNEEYSAYDPSHTFVVGQERFPVVNVSYVDAEVYCNWLSQSDTSHLYRLPTEEEWILAAGHMPKDIVINSDFVETGLTSVDAYASSTGACGGVDFWGNCWEWTSTRVPTGSYIVKGGSWDSDRDACRTEYSDTALVGTGSYPNVGFRVVRVDR